MSVIGVGTAVAYELGTADVKFPVLVETVGTFLAQGGAVIDTSPTYGRAEKSLGEIFRRIGGRERAFLATKISTTGEQAGIDSVAASLRDLGTDQSDSRLCGKIARLSLRLSLCAVEFVQCGACLVPDGAGLGPGRACLVPICVCLVPRGVCIAPVGDRIAPVGK